jgi:hypothetical protein
MRRGNSIFTFCPCPGRHPFVLARPSGVPPAGPPRHVFRSIAARLFRDGAQGACRGENPARIYRSQGAAQRNPARGRGGFRQGQPRIIRERNGDRLRCQAFDRGTALLVEGSPLPRLCGDCQAQLQPGAANHAADARRLTSRLPPLPKSRRMSRSRGEVAAQIAAQAIKARYRLAARVCHGHRCFRSGIKKDVDGRDTRRS